MTGAEKTGRLGIDQARKIYAKGYENIRSKSYVEAVAILGMFWYSNEVKGLRCIAYSAIMYEVLIEMDCSTLFLFIRYEGVRCEKV